MDDESGTQWKGYNEEIETRESSAYKEYLKPQSYREQVQIKKIIGLR